MRGLGSGHVTCGPMKGLEINSLGGDTDVHTHGHRDSMTESAQWADSVKIMLHFIVLYFLCGVEPFFVK